MDRRDATRNALLEAGRALFAEKGFAETSTEEIVARAGVTRGALYHHYKDKTDLFRGVFEQIGHEVNEKVAVAIATADGIIESASAGLLCYLEACRTPDMQRISVQDGPGVLGWDEWWQGGDEHGLGHIRKVLQRAIDEGLIDPLPVDLVAHMVRGAMMEAGHLVSRDPNMKIEEVAQILLRFLLGLLRDEARRELTPPPATH